MQVSQISTIQTTDRTIEEIARTVNIELIGLGLMPDVHVFYPYLVEPGSYFPENHYYVACFVSTTEKGTHFIHVELNSQYSVSFPCRQQILLAESGQGWDKSWEIAAAVARMLGA